MNIYKNLSDNTVSELLSLMNEIEYQIKNTYLHVSDNLPKEFIKIVDKVRNDIVKEMENREDLD